MRSYEAALKLEATSKAYPEDIYLVAYERTKEAAFGDSYYGAIYQTINVKELQHRIDTVRVDLPSDLKVYSPTGDESVEWELTDGFEGIWYEDENATEHLLDLSWAKAPLEADQQYELFHLRIVSIGEDLTIKSGDCKWENASLLGYYIVKEIATDALTVFMIDTDTDNNHTVRIVEEQERHGLLGKLLCTSYNGSFSSEPLEYQSVVTAKVSDEYL